MQSTIKVATGIFIILLGVIGLFLPLLQGVLLILLGVFILKHRNLTYKEIKQKMKRTFKRRSKDSTNDFD